MKKSEDDLRVSWQDFRSHEKRVLDAIQPANTKKAILVIGDLGAGKSFTINRLMGVDYVEDLNGDLIPDPAQQNQKIYCKTSGERVSSTIFPQVVSAEGSDLAYIDTPGFKHVSAGDESPAAIATTIPIILNNAKIHGFLVLNEYNALSPQRGHMFGDFVNRLNKVIPVEALQDRVSFAFSKVVEQRVNVVNQTIRRCTTGILPANVINGRCYTVSAIGNPDVAPIRAALDFAINQPVIDKTKFVVNDSSVNLGGPFNNLAIIIENASNNLQTQPGNTTTLIKKLYEALLKTVKAYHRIYTCEMHIPDFNLLCGGEFKNALAALYEHYEKDLFLTESFPSQEFANIMAHFEQLRKDFDTHFKEAADQLAEFQLISNSMQEFNQKRQALKLPAPDALPAQHIGNKANESALTKFRHFQAALLDHSHYVDYTGSQFTTAALNNVQDHAGYLLRQYKPATKCKVVNPLLFAQLTQAFIAQEQAIKLSDDENLDPDNELLAAAKKLLADNVTLLKELENDKTFFDGLVNDYYAQLTAVNSAKDAYINDYQTAVTSPLATSYANGKSGVTVNGLNLLGNPTTFVDQFSNATLNKLTGTFTSGRVLHRHGSADDKVLNLESSRIFDYLKGQLPKELLAAEYLDLIRFTDVRQTADVEHPVIPVSRTGQAARDCIDSLQPNILHKGDNYAGFFGIAFFEKDDIYWNINLALKAKLTTAANDQDIYDLKLAGDYKGIVAATSLWFQEGGNKYSDPGGTGGFTHGLSSALAPFVKKKWETGENTKFTATNKNTMTVDVNAWFTKHRGHIKAALCDTGDPARATLVSNYKNALSSLDLAVLKLKLYAQLIGKDINNTLFTSLVDSTKISQEINNNHNDVTKSDLTPTLTAAIAAPDKLSGSKIIALDVVSGATCQKYLTASNNLLHAHSAWRVSKKPIPKLKLISPDKLVTINDYLLDLDGDSPSVTLQHRPLKTIIFARVARKLSELRQLKHLTLKEIAADNKAMLSLLSAVKDTTPVLTHLDISNNPCMDTGASAQELREVIGTLIANGKELTSLDVSYTKLGGHFVSYLTILLAKQPSLTSINLMGIEPCTNEVGLDLLAGLFISNSVTECKINTSSVDMLIADAIQFILKHRRENASAIPQDLHQRLDYFDKQLKIFLDSRAPVVSALDVRSKVFANFSLKERALTLVNKVAGLTFADVAKAKNPSENAAFKVPGRKASIDKQYVKSVLGNPRFFKPLDAKSRESKLHVHLQNYRWFHTELNTRFGLQRQQIPGDGNCQFASIAHQLLQLYPQQFPAELAEKFPQRDPAFITARLRQVAVDYIRRHREEFRPFFAAGSLEYEGFGQLDEYLDHLGEDGVWGGDMTLHAISRALNRTIYVMKPDFFEHMAEPILPNRQQPFHLEESIIVLYNGINHYETITQRPADNRLNDYYRENLQQADANVVIH